MAQQRQIDRENAEKAASRDELRDLRREVERLRRGAAYEQMLVSPVEVRYQKGGTETIIGFHFSRASKNVTATPSQNPSTYVALAHL
jgi:hypothetical protein